MCRIGSKSPQGFPFLFILHHHFHPGLFYSYFTLLFLSPSFLSPCSSPAGGGGEVPRGQEGVLFVPACPHSLCISETALHRLLLHTQSRQEVAECLANWTENNVFLSYSLSLWRKWKVGEFSHSDLGQNLSTSLSLFSLWSQFGWAPFVYISHTVPSRKEMLLKAILKRGENPHTLIALPHKYTEAHAGRLTDSKQERER